jgi:hypothetical protein
MLEFESEDETAFPHKEITQAIIGAAFGHCAIWRFGEPPLPVSCQQIQVAAIDLNRRCEAVLICG